MRQVMVVALLLVAQLAVAQLPPFAGSLDDAAIQYEKGALRDPVALLQQRLDRGETRLEFGPRHGYLESLLAALEIPVSSQGLVFSKTSLQMKRISPAKPRAIYFNDDVYVGFVQGSSVLEVSSVDPEKGAVFYTLRQKRAEKPRFERVMKECLECHVTVNTMKVPGHLVRSVYPDSTGEPVLEAGSFLTDHRSPLRERWGGWYVTGTHGEQRHMGNAFLRGKRPERMDLEPGANLTDLKKLVNTSPYLSPHSDIVALMVLEHQVRMHNLITRVAFEARLAPRQTPPNMDSMVEALLRYLLFADEARLTAPVEGTSTFRADFEARGPRDKQGRCLRQMDLQRRMFRYPCSFLIYSESFDAQPAPVKDRLYRRLWEVLSGKDRSPAYAALSATDRQAILEILRDTKKGLPAYFF